MFLKKKKILILPPGIYYTLVISHCLVDSKFYFILDLNQNMVSYSIKAINSETKHLTF